MNNRGRGRANASRRPRRPVTSRTVLGAPFTPPTDPPMFAARPWVPFNMQLTFSLSQFTGTLKVDAILSTLLQLYGLSPDTTAFIGKLHMISVWCTNVVKGGSALAFPPQLTVQVFNPDEDTPYSIAVLTDTGTAGSYSRVGYRYGEALQARIFELSSTKPLLKIAVANSNIDSNTVRTIIRVTGLWAYGAS